MGLVRAAGTPLGERVQPGAWCTGHVPNPRDYDFMALGPVAYRLGKLEGRDQS